MVKERKYGKPMREYPRIRPVYSNEKPTGEYAVVDGKKEKKRGTLAEMIKFIS